MPNRRIWNFTACAAVVAVLSGCQTASAPERRELLGSWISDDVAGVVIRMTVAETARSVEGAGFWSEAQTSSAFQVSGALARDEVALHFDFDEQTDMSFQGYFADEDIIVGTLAGARIGQRAITFDREDLFED